MRYDGDTNDTRYEYDSDYDRDDTRYDDGEGKMKRNIETIE